MEFVDVQRTGSGEIQISRAGAETALIGAELVDRSPVLRNMLSPADGAESTAISFPAGYLFTWLGFVHGREANESCVELSVDALIEILKV